MLTLSVIVLFVWVFRPTLECFTYLKTLLQLMPHLLTAHIQQFRSYILYLLERTI